MLSQASKRLTGQRMFQILEQVKDLRHHGQDIIELQIGDPEYNTPENIKGAFIEAITRNETHYAPSGGIIKLKEEYAKYIERTRGFKPDLDQLLVTSGANIQIYYALACLDGSVYIPNPGFVSYTAIADYIGKERGYDIVIKNNPCNPTGQIEDVPQGKYYILDDVYQDLIFNPKQNGRDVNEIIVNSFSKSHLMTGWRIGVMYGPKELIAKCQLLLETTESCVSPFLQYAAVEALKTDMSWLAKDLIHKKDIACEEISKIKGVKFKEPEGGFYLWIDVSEAGMTGDQFAEKALKGGVAVAEGSMFGSNGKNHIRINYAINEWKLKEGIKRIGKIL